MKSTCFQHIASCALHGVRLLPLFDYCHGRALSVCRYAELGGHIEISPTDPSDPLYPRQPDAISMDVRSAAFGSRLTDFKIQFLPPCFVLYYIPSPLVRPSSSGYGLTGQDRLAPYTGSHICLLKPTPYLLMAYTSGLLTSAPQLHVLRYGSPWHRRGQRPSCEDILT